MGIIAIAIFFLALTIYMAAEILFDKFEEMRIDTEWTRRKYREEITEKINSEKSEIANRTDMNSMEKMYYISALEFVVREILNNENRND